MYKRTAGLGGRGLGDALVTSLASAIRRVEGVNPNFAANNNPGNLVYAGQPGAVRGAGGFAKFPTPEAGEAALEWQIQNYIDRGYDLTTFFNTYAPGNTKNAAGGVQTPAATQAYINSVSSQLGLDPSVPLKSVQSSFTGPGSVASTSAAAPDPYSVSSFPPAAGGFDLSALTSSDSSFDIGGVVLSGPELLALGAAVVGVVVLFSIL